MDNDTSDKTGPAEFKSDLSKKVLVRTEKVAKLAPDQVCDEELLPANRGDIKASQQVDWTVELGKGAVYPFKNGIYGHNIIIRYGSRIGGPLVAGKNIDKVEGKIAIEGGSAKTPGQLLGSVVCEGQVEIVEPKAKLEDYKPAPVFIFGDIIADRISIRTPVIVYGNLLANNGIEIDHPLWKVMFSKIYGTIWSSGGVIALKNMVAGAIMINDNKTEPIQGKRIGESKIMLNEGVTLVNPQIIAIGGSISIQKNVRYIGLSCIKCDNFPQDDAQKQLYLNCTLYLRGLCDRYCRLSGEDILEDHLLPDRKVLYAEPGWRAVSEIEEIHKARALYFQTQFIERTQERDLDSLIYSGTGGARDPVSVVNNVVQYIDQSTKIQDSIINRSNLGNAAGKEISGSLIVRSNIGKTDDGERGKIQDSIIQRSNIADDSIDKG